MQAQWSIIAPAVGIAGKDDENATKRKRTAGGGEDDDNDAATDMALVNLRFAYDAFPYTNNEDRTIGQFTVDAAVERQYVATLKLPEWIMFVIMRAAWERRAAMFKASDAWYELDFAERAKIPQPPQPESGGWEVGFRFYPGDNIDQWTSRGQLLATPRPYRPYLEHYRGHDDIHEQHVRNRFKVSFPDGKAFIVSPGSIDEVPFYGS